MCIPCVSDYFEIWYTFIGFIVCTWFENPDLNKFMNVNVRNTDALKVYTYISDRILMFNMNQFGY